MISFFSVLRIGMLMVLGLQAVVVAQLETASGRRPALLEPSVILRNERDYELQMARLKRAQSLGCRHVNFVATVNCQLDEKKQVVGYGLVRQGRWQPMSADMQLQLQAYFHAGLKFASANDMRIAILCHLDVGEPPDIWRNEFRFDPLEEYAGFSYESALIKPLVLALHAATPADFPIDFSIAGEMGTSVFAYPTHYERVVHDLRERLASKRLSVGVSFNFNKVQGTLEEVGERSGMQRLIDECDFVGFSNYHPVGVPPAAGDFVQSIEAFAADLRRHGVVLQDDDRLHFSEIAIGGFGSEGFTRDPQQAARTLWKGTNNPQQSPWRDQGMRQFRREYHEALLKFLREQPARWPVDVAFLWSDGSWDPQGIAGPSFTDDVIIDRVKQHNAQVSATP